ncbi:AMP-binding protein [Sandaracinobacteroides saxicola]|uniref:AMP-binding protein n=1 Tax=Sandaracinobacteroides saxicola TaxID=2759707 RepID=A0A7G5IJH7_9SPHN|nr:AMP-binding protein [Sandaracinobacteroides saxicola]QMW23519.1 AMP-binding protein [Sandaracinobacteroides saxicola]
MSGLSPATIAARDPGRAAVIIDDDRLSYADLDQQSAHAAARLHALGLQPRDTVALLLNNSPAFFAAAWAAQRSGLYYLPLPAKATVPELAYLLADSGARALITDPPHQTIAATAAAGLPLTILSLADALAPTTAPPAPALEGGDMLYTSGSTGRPKGVKRALTLAPLGSEARRVERARLLFGLDDGSIFLTPAPLYHAAPLRFAMNLLRVGGTVIGMAKFDAAQALALIETHRVTHSQWVPTMFVRLLALNPRPAHDLSSHIRAIHGAAPCPPHVKRAMIDWWGPILHEYYSGTESVGFTHATSAEWLARPGTAGRAHGCKIHILDDAGQELPPGQTGMVYFSGSGGLAYHNAPEKTAAAHNAQGWATMGDIGHVDADGYLYLTDRRAFTIISGGVNIYPREIEDALMAQPGVADCAVFGVPDDDLGEAVQALVQLEPGMPQDTPGLLAALAALLSPPKRPRWLAFVAQLPRTETGKLDKATLKRDWAARPDRGHCARALKAAA